MTHQTVLQEDPDSPMVPESPVPLFDAVAVDSPNVIPPTPPHLRRPRSTRNLLEAFTDLDDDLDEIQSPGSPIWQSSQLERRCSDCGSSEADASSSSSQPASPGNGNSKTCTMTAHSLRVWGYALGPPE